MFLDYLGKIGRKIGIKNPFLLKAAIFDGPFFYRSNHWYSFICQFTSYIDKKESYDALVSGLDDLSISVVKEELRRIRLYLENRLILESEIFSDLDIYEQKKLNDLIKSGVFGAEFFYSDFGIFSEKKRQDYVKGSVIIDCGAYDGDSSYYFAKHLIPKIVYSFEPDHNNYKLLKKNIKKHNLENIITPVQKGVGETNCIGIIKGSDEGSCLELLSFNGENRNNYVDVVSIDDYFKNCNERIGCIKRDIEGLEYESVLGAKKVISHHKPILLISIYHNGKQFFELKSLIESRGLGYNFKIRKIDPRMYRQETILICY